MKVPHNRLTFDSTEIESAVSVLRSGLWAGDVRLKMMERRLADLFGADGAAGVASGSAALRLALLACGVEAGDEVLVPAYSCVALANAVLSIGAVPMPVDSLPGNWNIDPADARKKRRIKTKALIAVNSFGIPAELPTIMDTNLAVIEDCSHGFSYGKNGTPLLQADMAVFSFYATKLIAGGEGGAVLARDAMKTDFVRSARDYADKAPDAAHFNDKMTDIEAALVLCQLERLPAMLALRREKAFSYNAAFAELPGVTLPENTADRVWYRYAVRLPPDRMEEIITTLAQAGISACRPVESWLDAQTLEAYPVAQEAFGSILSLPLYPTLTEAEQNHVIHIFKKVAETWKAGH